jgi:hypothetical protein
MMPQKEMDRSQFLFLRPAALRVQLSASGHSRLGRASGEFNNIRNSAKSGSDSRQWPT